MRMIAQLDTSRSIKCAVLTYHFDIAVPDLSANNPQVP